MSTRARPTARRHSEVPPASRAVLRERSRELATRRLDVESRETVAEVVVLRRADVTWAIPLVDAQEVRLVEVVHVPGAGGAVAGMFHIRGRTYGLIDLAWYFGEPESADREATALVLVVSGRPGALGIRVDEVLGARTLFADEIDDGLAERELGFVSQVTHDRVQVIDVATLLDSPGVRITG